VETQILERWGIDSILVYIGPSRINTASSNSSETWEPPPQTIFKLNFDGAAKGNPGLAGVGGVIRDLRGEILGIYWGCIGVNTNNVANLKVLLEGLEMSSTHGWFPIILEGDSQIILQMAEKLLNGK
jgi:hypothetical protein